jgi:anti-anti-sigma regulatory factor
MSRSSVRTRILGTRFVSRLQGELNGSTACRILEVVAQAPAQIQQIVVDLGAASAVESFGLDVLVRGIPSCARGRRVQVLGMPVSGEASAVPGGDNAVPRPAPTDPGARGGARPRRKTGARSSAT